MPGFNSLAVPELLTEFDETQGVVGDFYCEEKVSFRVNLHPVFRLLLLPLKCLL